MNILIIEDDQRVAELIQRGLEEQGFALSLAYDGLSGKKLALQNHYDLIAYASIGAPCTWVMLILLLILRNDVFHDNKVDVV